METNLTKNGEKMSIYRHGDLLIKPATKREGAKKSEGKIDLALGEATGHHHQLQKTALFLGEPGKIDYFEIEEPTNLTHQEHVTLTILPGAYEIVMEREYDYFENEMKKVVD